MWVKVVIGNQELDMYTAMYGSRTFILDNQSAYEVMKCAAELLTNGLAEDARAALSLAVRVENGTAGHNEIEDLLGMRRAA